jgi:hypothetical protein
MTRAITILSVTSWASEIRTTCPEQDEHERIAHGAQEPLPQQGHASLWRVFGPSRRRSGLQCRCACVGLPGRLRRCWPCHHSRRGRFKGLELIPGRFDGP